MRFFLATLFVVLMAGAAAFGDLTPELRSPAEILEAEQGIKDAVRDAAQADVALWTLAGCCGGVLGIVIAYVIPPDILPTKLLGKSAMYVSYYTETYQQQVRNRRTKYAAGGCLVTATVYGGCYALGIYASILDTLY